MPPDEPKDIPDGSVEQESQRASPTISTVSSKAFQAAKEYYEQLILQYPFQKTHPHSVNALNFYPTYFGLCIYEAEQRTRAGLKRLEVTASSPRSSATRQGQEDEDEDEPQSRADERNQEVLELKQVELDSAQRIAAKMDELLVSPPYDKYQPLRQLRGMVGLWLADLLDNVDARTNRGRADVERDKARDVFSRLRKDGAILPLQVESLAG